MNLQTNHAVRSWLSDFLRSRGVLIVALVVFVVCKIPHLFYPYYWDESWPYAVAVKQMYLHGISILPSALDPEISRGHPLFFHAAAASWMHVFGASRVAIHSFPLFISVLLLIAIYEAGLRLFNRRVAFLALLLFMGQVMFFVQSAFLLFEILVAFLAFLSLYFYINQRYFLTALALTVLFYTKESGLVMGVVLGSDAAINLLNKQKTWADRFGACLSIAVPYMLIGVFFILQKLARGWFIFPFYNGLIEHKWSSIWYNFRRNSLRNVFFDELSPYYYYLFLALAAIAAVKNRNIAYLAVFLPAIVIYLAIDDGRSARLPSTLLFASFIFCTMLMLYSFEVLKLYDTPRQRKWITLSCAFIFCFFCFSSLNFFTFRYLFPAIILLFFFIAVIADKLIERTSGALYYLAVAAMLAIGFSSYRNDKEYGDTHLTAFGDMQVQQSVVDYMEETKDYGKTVGAGSFLEIQHLLNPQTGFLHSDSAFRHTSWPIDRNTDYAIFDNIEPDYRYSEFNKDSAFQLVFRYQKGGRWAEVYKRKKGR